MYVFNFNLKNKILQPQERSTQKNVSKHIRVCLNIRSSLEAYNYRTYSEHCTTLSLTLRVHRARRRVSPPALSSVF